MNHIIEYCFLYRYSDEFVHIYNRFTVSNHEWFFHGLGVLLSFRILPCITRAFEVSTRNGCRWKTFFSPSFLTTWSVLSSLVDGDVGDESAVSQSLSYRRLCCLNLGGSLDAATHTLIHVWWFIVYACLHIYIEDHYTGSFHKYHEFCLGVERKNVNLLIFASYE